jgi:hypothetical protein
MKKIRFYGVLIVVLLSLASVLVFAQDTPVSVQQTAGALPTSMETALVPCTADTTGPCDIIATSAEDIVGIWKQYLGNPRFNAPDGMAYVRYNADGTYVLADTVENTAQTYEPYPSGSYEFDELGFTISPAVAAPATCDTAPHYQVRVLKYGDQPVALRYIPLEETCAGRLQDFVQALVWVAP